MCMLGRVIGMRRCDKAELYGLYYHTVQMGITNHNVSVVVTEGERGCLRERERERERESREERERESERARERRLTHDTWPELRQQ